MKKRFKGQSNKSKDRIKGVSGNPEITNELFLLSFKDLDKSQGQTLSSWENDAILAHAIDVLGNYCKSKLESQLDKKFTIYGDFPDSAKTDFSHPKHVTEDAKWARIHAKGKQCIIGHVVDNVFYVVFLDGNHDFWITEKKNT